VAVNLLGVISGCRLAGARMRERGGGVIVNVASLAGLFGAPALATYCATKFAVVGLTEALQKEFQSIGIHVAAVLPAVVDTELSAGARYPRGMKPVIEIEPRDVAGAIVGLASSRGPAQTVPGDLGCPCEQVDCCARPFVTRWRAGLA
jgi:NAD(P)-dependent dehydrogenase (short-subunit alcohol dehydrogenase family)